MGSEFSPADSTSPASPAGDAKKRRTNPVTISMPADADAVCKLTNQDREAFVLKAVEEKTAAIKGKLSAAANG